MSLLSLETTVLDSAMSSKLGRRSVRISDEDFWQYVYSDSLRRDLSSCKSFAGCEVQYIYDMGDSDVNLERTTPDCLFCLAGSLGGEWACSTESEYVSSHWYPLGLTR